MKNFLFAVFLLIYVLSSWQCGVRDKDSTVVETAGPYAGLSDSVTYVGMEVCGGCHTDIHSTYQHTGMGSSFGKATPLKSSGDFNDNPVVYDRFRDLHYHPYWKNDSLWFREFRLSGKDTTYNREERISWIVGSGQHTNSHIWEKNGYHYQAPLTFYTQKGVWDLPPGFENGNNTRFSRIIGTECMTCHNAYPEWAGGAENKFSQVKNGIDCERCHGPGSEHVRQKRAGIMVDTSRYIDYTIVNPRKLPIDFQFDICQRCHIQGNAVLNDDRTFFDFKPGMRLSSVMNVFMPVFKGGEDQHIMASHAERLKLSPCYQQSEKAYEESIKKNNLAFDSKITRLTCITCHNPHVSVKSTGKDKFNTVCQSCHSDPGKSLCTENNMLRSQNNDNCVSCHMPMQGTIDIPHVSVHDHRISIPARKKNQQVQAMKEFIGIACINNPDPPASAKAQAFINYVEKFGMHKALLDSALHYLPAGSREEVEQNIRSLIHVYFLKGDFSSVIANVRQVPGLMKMLTRQDPENRDAWTSYRIGEAFQAGSQNDKALPWYENAHRLSQGQPDFAGKYANALIAAGQLEKGRNILVNLTTEHPEYAPGWSNLGFLILSAEKNALKAHEYIDKALALDPDYLMALKNKVAACMSQGDTKSASIYLQRAVKINPSDAQLNGLLSQIKQHKR